MDKAMLIEALCRVLTEEREAVARAAAAAAEGATHEEAKPENEYDTRGLEQSYLAGAQSARLDALDASLASLRAYRPPTLPPGAPVAVGACVIVDDGESERAYFLSEVGGGSRLEVQGRRWLVLNPRSPLGRALLGHRAGDVVERVVRGRSTELELLSVT